MKLGKLTFILFIALVLIGVLGVIRVSLPNDRSKLVIAPVHCEAVTKLGLAVQPLAMEKP